MPENNMKGKIFNAQEVQAIIAGNKTMFREVVKVQLPEYKKATMFNGKAVFATHDLPVQFVKCPYQVGQKIFVKESFSDERFGKNLVYKADNKIEKISHWRTASNMKQEHSRLTLLIKSIGVERLGDISEEDCWADGLDTSSNYADFAVRRAVATNQPEVGARDYFREKWNATHKKPKEKFEANPWVWKVKFEVINN